MKNARPAETAKPSALGEADSTGNLLAVLERIACALERQNELLEVQNDAIFGVANRVEDVASCL